MGEIATTPLMFSENAKMVPDFNKLLLVLAPDS